MIVMHLAGALEQLLDWPERRRGRRALLGLDDRMLKDVGLSRCDLDRMDWEEPR